MPNETDIESSYFQDWYKVHGEKLNESRKDRYQNDPEYREKVLAQNRKARRKKREESKSERLAQRAAQKVKPSKAWKSVNWEIEDEDGTKRVVKMFTISAVARSLDCSVQALRMWERKGIIESTPYRYSKGDRLYTVEQIEAMRKHLTKEGRVGPNKTKIKSQPYVEKKVVMAGRKRGRKTRLFRIGTMAQLVGRTVVTLEQLENKGSLPETPFRLSEAGHRLYTLGMMKAVKKAFDKRDGEVRGEEAWQGLFSDVKASWEAMGVMGAHMQDLDD